MQIINFIERLKKEIEGENVECIGIHKIFPPNDKELETWVSQKEGNSLPEDFIELLRQTNGIQFWVSKGSPNGYLRLFPLHEIDFARQIMWLGALNDMEQDATPRPHWLAISEDQDHSTFIVLDPDTKRYYLMDSCGADLTCPAGNNINELLDYIWERWVENMKE